jgi:hypothetical protein
MGAICFAAGTPSATGCAGATSSAFYNLALPATAPAASYGTTVIMLTISSGP